MLQYQRGEGTVSYRHLDDAGRILRATYIALEDMYYLIQHDPRRLKQLRLSFNEERSANEAYLGRGRTRPSFVVPMRTEPASGVLSG